MSIFSIEAFRALSSTLVDGVTAGFARIDSAVSSTMTQVRALATEMRSLALPGGALGAGNAGLRNAARRGRGDLHYRADGVPISGGHIDLGSGPVMGAVAVGGYSIYSALKTQDDALKTALTAQVDPSQLGLGSQEYQRIIQDGAAETSESVDSIAEAYQRGIRGTQGIEPAKRLALIKSLLPVAEAEIKLKGSSIGETLQSFLELGHMTGDYNPESLKQLSNKFSIASLSVNSNLPEFAKTLSYSLPTATRWHRSGQ